MTDFKSNDSACPAVIAERLPNSTTTASAIIRNLVPGEPFDARAVLAETGLENSPSAVLDLAAEQFLRESESGSPATAEEFAAQFPTHYETLLLLLTVDGLIDQQQTGLDEEVDWPSIGRTYLGFQLIHEVSRGALSRVFLARETAVGDRPVVVKVCLGGAREAGILGRLKHPHIGEIYSVQFDEPAGLTTICMPFTGTATLHNEMAREFQPVSTDQENPARPKTERKADRRDYIDRVVQIGRQIADALAYTHGEDVLHGDIKPENIVLADGEARLIDFNLSRRLREDAGPVGGTYPYMAPEHLRELACGDYDSPVSRAGDVYSLAATLFHALTGRLPFDADSKAAFPSSATEELDRREKATVTYRQTGRYLPRVYRQVERVLRRCLAADPESRPAAGELFEVLKTATRRAETASRSRVSRASRILVAAIVASAAMLAVGTNLNREPSPAGGGRDVEGGVPAPQPRPKPNHEAEARAALEDEEFDRAIEHLTPLIVDEKHPRHRRHLEWLGYAKARNAAKKAALLKDVSDAKSLRKPLVMYASAVSAFESALRGENDEDAQRQLLESIGWCRIRMNELRLSIDVPAPRGFEKSSEQEVIIEIASQLANYQNPDRTSNFALMSYAIRKWPQNVKLVFAIAYLHALKATKGFEPADELSDSVPLVLEMLWGASTHFVNQPRVVRFRLESFPVQAADVSKHPEFRHLRSRGLRKPQLKRP